jgi:hypothetical protein
MTALPVFRVAFPFHNPTTNRLLNSIAESLVQKPSLESEKNEHMVYAGNDKWASTKWLQEQREKKEAKRKGAYPLLNPSSNPFPATVLCHRTNEHQRNSSSARKKRRSGKRRM